MTGERLDEVCDALIAFLRENPGVDEATVVSAVAVSAPATEPEVETAIKYTRARARITTRGGGLIVRDQDLPDDRAAALRAALTGETFTELETLIGADAAAVLRSSDWLSSYESRVAAAALRHAGEHYSDWHVVPMSDGYGSIAQHGLTPGEWMQKRATTLEPAAGRAN